MKTEKHETKTFAYGCIISALGSILLIRVGFSATLLGVLAVGIVLFVIGLFWK